MLGVNVVTNGCMESHHVCVLGVNISYQWLRGVPSCLRVGGKCCYRWLHGVPSCLRVGGKCCYRWLRGVPSCLRVVGKCCYQWLYSSPVGEVRWGMLYTALLCGDWVLLYLMHIIKNFSFLDPDFHTEFFAGIC